MERRYSKGHQGYVQHRKMYYIGLTAVLILLVVVFVVLSKVVPQPHKPIMIVMAILSVLPMANIFSTMVVMMPCKSVPEDQYERFANAAGTGLISAELHITGTKLPTIPLMYAYVHPNGIIGYWEDTKIDKKKAEEYIEATLRAGGVDTKMTIFTDFEKFLNRVSELQEKHPVSEETADEKLMMTHRNLRAISL
ncbi:MAG: hypothetical protein J5825_08300 [Lachnospiraceae bacterium]|nr:hypothetical protein [Lachnospiraceae bacterium]